MVVAEAFLFISFGEYAPAYDNAKVQRLLNHDTPYSNKDYYDILQQAQALGAILGDENSLSEEQMEAYQMEYISLSMILTQADEEGKFNPEMTRKYNAWLKSVGGDE